MSSFKTPKGTVLPILNLRGKDYLQVAHRLVWFREERPEWSIETFIIKSDDKHSVAKAEIKDQTGRTLSTAHKREDEKHFPDHMEKAETGAIGRALAMVGFGTQFTGDELEEGDRLADAPLPKKASPRSNVSEIMPNGGIHPEQPPENGDDGNVDPNALGYKIPFGKFKQRSLEEVGPDELRSYVLYLESKAKKDGKTITGPVATFIEMASDYVGSFENGSFS